MALVEKKPGGSDPGCLKRVYFPLSLHCLIAHGSQECFPVKAGQQGPQSCHPAPCPWLLGRKELFPAAKRAPLLQRASFSAFPASQKETSPGSNGLITRCLVGRAISSQMPGFAICAAPGLWEGTGLTLPFHLTQPSHSRDYPRLSKAKLRSRRPPILPGH